MIRSRMTHRAQIERNMITGPDAYGNEQAPSWGVHIAAQPCYYWQPKIGPGEIQGEQMLMPWEVDITTGDRVNGIKDRKGDYLTEEVFYVISITYKPDHLLIASEGRQNGRQRSRA